MANLVVRNIDDQIVRALKEKAGRSGHSADLPKKKTFAEVLAEMPNVGKDSDFERLQESDEINVFN